MTEDPKTASWETGSPAWTVTISVPRDPGESNTDWEDRFQRIKAEAEAAFPPI